MENSTGAPTNITTCLDCGNEQPLNNSKVCYPWVAGEFIGRNYTIDELNDVVMKRNIAGMIFLGFVMFFGIVGNGHVLFVFSKRKYKSNYIQDRIHANYRIFILWLSIFGLIECGIVAPLLIVYLRYPVTYPSNALCKIFRFILYFVPVTISLTLIAIAVDRYLVICRTFENKLTSKHSKIMCFATLVIALILTFPSFIVFGNGKTETGIPGLTGMRCYLESMSMLKLQQLYQALLVVFFFVVMLVLLILYTKVRGDYKKLLKFRHTSRRYSASTPKSIKRNQAKQESQRVWIYGSVTFGYVASALPYHILAILFFAQVIVDCDMNLEQANVFYMFIWSYFFSPVINPIIYGFQDDGFKYSVKNMYKHSTNSLRKYLFNKRDSDDDIPNGIDRSDTIIRSGSQTCTQITDESDGHLSNVFEYKTNGEPKSELKEIITSIAAITLNVNELVVQDVNKNSVHI